MRSTGLGSGDALTIGDAKTRTEKELVVAAAAKARQTTRLRDVFDDGLYDTTSVRDGGSDADETKAAKSTARLAIAPSMTDSVQVWPTRWR